MLLYAGANVGAKTRIGGYTPLHLAAQIGNAARDRAAGRRGAPVNAATATGATALMQAAHSGSTDAVRILLENGADPNAEGNRQRPDGADVRGAARPHRRGEAAAAGRRPALTSASSTCDVAVPEEFSRSRWHQDATTADQNGVPRRRRRRAAGGDVRRGRRRRARSTTTS